MKLYTLTLCVVLSVAVRNSLSRPSVGEQSYTEAGVADTLGGQGQYHKNIRVLARPNLKDFCSAVMNFDISNAS